MLYKAIYISPLGPLTLASDGDALIGLWIEGQKRFVGAAAERWVERPDMPLFAAAKDWLDRYFAGENPTASGLPMAPVGGDFRQTIWTILTEIPYGEVVSYGAIAKKAAQRLGKSRMSAQAVGGAVGHNPISILIPCHRVVGSSGSLTGYAGGMEKKIWLLSHEGVDMTRLSVPKGRLSL